MTGLLVFFLSLAHAIGLAAAGRCFEDRDELQTAVDQYVQQGCSDASSDCETGREYGRPMNSWCVGNVTDMSNLFRWKGSFNEDVSGWDVSRVSDMGSMFEDAGEFDGDLSRWNTSRVANMGYMFETAGSFNGDISSWDVSGVTDMGEMFEDATSFNQDLCAWGDKFRYECGHSTIFGFSGCPFQGNPERDQKGPFCASPCMEQDPDPDTSASPEPLSSLSKTAASHVPHPIRFLSLGVPVAFLLLG